MSDLSKDLFAEQTYGKIALVKMSPFPENFRLYSVEWLGDKPSEFDVMKIVGAEFRLAKSGVNKGKLSVMIKDTKRTAYVTKGEMRSYDIQQVG